MSRGGTACSLALLLAAAGFAAGDAHAQTNTQRLITVESVTGGISDVVDDIRDALDSAAAELANMLAAIAGLRTSADSVSNMTESAGSGVAGLRNETGALKTAVSGLNASASNLKVGAAANGAAADAAAAKASALNASAYGLRDGVSVLNASAYDMRDKVASLNASAAAVGAAADAAAAKVSALNASVSAAVNRTGAADAAADSFGVSLGRDTANDAHAKLDRIYAGLLRHGAVPRDADNATASSLALVEARLDSLETELRRAESALLAIRASVLNLEVPANVTDPSYGDLRTVVTGYTADTSHYARTADARPADNIYEYNIDFACRSTVFVRDVEVSTIQINNATPHPVLAKAGLPVGGDGRCEQINQGSQENPRYVDDPNDPDCTAPRLPLYDANPFGPDTTPIGLRSAIDANGITVIDTLFIPSRGADPTRYHQPAAFDVFKLSPGSVLRTSTTMNATVLMANMKVFDGVPGRNHSFFDHAALAGSNRTLADLLKLDLYNVRVTALADGDPGCRLVAGGADAYGQEQSAVLAVTGEGNLIRTFRASLDCNDMPARITSTGKVLFSFGGTVGPDFVNLASLALKAGGRSMEFGFNSMAELVPKPDTASFLVWHGGDLELSGTIPIVQGAAIQVNYQTVPGNTCTPR